MKEDQLKLLETRINGAINFIENLKQRERLLIAEKEELMKRIGLLEKNVDDRDRKNEELHKTQKYLREKIETILGKLEGLAELYQETTSSFEGSSQEGEVREPPVAGPGPRGRKDPGRNDGGIIIDENIVDLKEPNNKSGGDRGPGGKEAGRQRPKDSGQKKGDGEITAVKPKQANAAKQPGTIKTDENFPESFTGELFNINPFVEI